MSRQHPFRPPALTARHGLEARFGAGVASLLTVALPPLPADVDARLRFARRQALERATAASTAAAPALPAARAPMPWATAVLAGAGAVGLPGGFDGPESGPATGWQRVTAWLPVLVLMAGLVGIDHWKTQEEILATADIDAALLADEVPPEAYSDPGFVEFLRNEPPTL
jgi:hypothetical protein